MRERLIAIRERRVLLLERAAVEREQLGTWVDRSDVATRWIAAGARLMEQARQHPLWLIAGVAFLFALRPRRMFGWLLKGWTLYQAYRRGRMLVERYAPGLLAPVRAP